MACCPAVREKKPHQETQRATQLPSKGESSRSPLLLMLSQVHVVVALAQQRLLKKVHRSTAACQSHP